MTASTILPIVQPPDSQPEMPDSPCNKTFCGRGFLFLTRSVVALIAAGLCAPVFPAEKTVWSSGSAVELAVFVTSMRFQIPADHCAVASPHLKPEFERLMAGLNTRINSVAKTLTSSEAGAGPEDKPVPTAIVNAFRDSFEDNRHNFERQDASTACPRSLQKLGQVTEESLISEMVDALTAIQRMMLNLEKAAAR